MLRNYGEADRLGFAEQMAASVAFYRPDKTKVVSAELSQPLPQKSPFSGFSLRGVYRVLTFITRKPNTCKRILRKPIQPKGPR